MSYAGQTNGDKPLFTVGMHGRVPLGFFFATSPAALAFFVHSV
jgi:hypothetical protein